MPSYPACLWFRHGNTAVRTIHMHSGFMGVSPLLGYGGADDRPPGSPQLAVWTSGRHSSRYRADFADSAVLPVSLRWWQDDLTGADRATREPTVCGKCPFRADFADSAVFPVRLRWWRERPDIISRLATASNRRRWKLRPVPTRHSAVTEGVIRGRAFSAEFTGVRGCPPLGCTVVGTGDAGGRRGTPGEMMTSSDG